MAHLLEHLLMGEAKEFKFSLNQGNGRSYKGGGGLGDVNRF